MVIGFNYIAVPTGQSYYVFSGPEQAIPWWSGILQFLSDPMVWAITMLFALMIIRLASEMIKDYKSDLRKETKDNEKPKEMSE